ncbi:MAG TPA: hypothetical protein PLT87_08730, partial [Spirochaetales bacterium]|nr:hypothetical protein [Spirochaetales bacterium]
MGTISKNDPNRITSAKKPSRKILSRPILSCTIRTPKDELYACLLGLSREEQVILFEEMLEDKKSLATTYSSTEKAVPSA